MLCLGGGVLPCIGYMGMCHWREYGFQVIWSSKGYGFQAIWSSIGSCEGSLTRLKSRTIEHFWSSIGSQNLV